MSRTRRIFVIASLIVFGLLAPAPSDAVLQHCTGPWSGSGDTMKAVCRFKLGGGALEVNGVALGGLPTSKVEVQLFRYPYGPSDEPLASCSGAGPGFAQCSGGGSVVTPPIQFDVVCVVFGVAVTGVFSCRTV